MNSNYLSTSSAADLAALARDLERVAALPVEGDGAVNDLSPGAAYMALHFLGIGAKMGDEFPDVIPGAPTGAVAVVDPSSLRYETPYPEAPKQWWSLAEVFASIIARQPVDLTRRAKGANVMHARWWARLWHQVGLDPVAVPTLALPSQSPDLLRYVGDAVMLAWALNNRWHPGEGVQFSRSFGTTWTGLGEYALGKALGELVRLGAIVNVDPPRVNVPGIRRPTATYVPGPRASRPEAAHINRWRTR